MKPLLLMIFALLLSGCETLQQLDRGLYQVTDAMTEKDRLTGQRVASSSRSQQIQSGNRAVENIKAQLSAKGIAYNDAYDARAYQRLNRIFQRIHSISHLKHEQWQLLLIPEDDFNAFVTGGTYIVVYAGLEKQLKDDSEIAAVIGHEFAHVVANHVGERQSHQQLALLSGSKSARRSSFNTAFTHENEEEADRLGILYAALAGYDPYAAYRVWNRMYQQKGDFGSMYVSHPVYSERSALARETANKVRQFYSPGEIHSSHAQVLKNNPLFVYRDTEFSKGGDGGGLATFLSAVVESQKAHQAAKAEEQRQKSRIQQLQTVNKLMKVVGVRQLSPDTWLFSVNYTGNRPLSSVVFNGSLFANGTELNRIRAKPEHRFQPGTQYNLIARSNKPVAMGIKLSGYKWGVTEVTVH